MLRNLNILTLALSIFVLGACKKSILEDDPGSNANKNVKVDIVPYFGDFLYNADSLYFAGGANFKIDEISILHSNFFFENNGDSLAPEEASLWKLSESKPVYIGELENGSYTGKYYYKVGLDSVSNIMPPSAYPETNPLNTEEDLYRGFGLGYNFVIIKGRIQNPSTPMAEPNIPMLWKIATSGFAIDYFRPQNFNLSAGNEMTISVKLQIDKLFEGLYPITTPVIKSDPTNQVDWGAAETLHANFKNKAYLIQI